MFVIYKIDLENDENIGWYIQHIERYDWTFIYLIPIVNFHECHWPIHVTCSWRISICFPRTLCQSGTYRDMSPGRKGVNGRHFSFFLNFFLHFKFFHFLKLLILIFSFFSKFFPCFHFFFIFFLTSRHWYALLWHVSYSLAMAQKILGTELLTFGMR
jgi:hypothetical protein